MQTSSAFLASILIASFTGCAAESPTEAASPMEEVGEVDSTSAALESVDGVDIEGPYFSYYLGWDYDNADREVGDCSSLFPMVFYKPEGDGPFPLFVYTVGTMTSHRAELAIEQNLKRMAARGFVAVSVAYDNYDYRVQGCQWYPPKAHCIYDESFWGSAVNILDWLSYVDTSRIVTGGHSQGAHISILSGNSSSSIRAAHPTGVTPTANCLNEVDLPLDRIRVGNGEHEDRHGCGSIWGAVLVGPEYNCETELLECNRPKVETLTGLSCESGAMRCFRDNGSGWFFVTDEELGQCAHHGFQKEQWRTTEESWGRDANHAWLAEMAR